MTGCALLLTSCGASAPEAEVPDEAGPMQPATGQDRPEQGGARQRAPAAAAAPAPEPTDMAAEDEAAEDEAAEDASRAAAISGSTGVEKLMTELLGMNEQFEDALEASAPDCDAARRFRDAVCDLAERICDITGTGSLSQTCDDGRRRCEQSKRAHARRCSP